jgi:hypothetical protein
MDDTRMFFFDEEIEDDEFSAYLDTYFPYDHMSTAIHMKENNCRDSNNNKKNKNITAQHGVTSSYNEYNVEKDMEMWESQLKCIKVPPFGDNRITKWRSRLRYPDELEYQVNGDYNAQKPKNDENYLLNSGNAAGKIQCASASASLRIAQKKSCLLMKFPNTAPLINFAPIVVQRPQKPAIDTITKAEKHQHVIQ